MGYFYLTLGRKKKRLRLSLPIIFVRHLVKMEKVINAVTPWIVSIKNELFVPLAIGIQLVVRCVQFTVKELQQQTSFLLIFVFFVEISFQTRNKRV